MFDTDVSNLSDQVLAALVKQGEEAAEELKRRSLARTKTVAVTKLADGHFLLKLGDEEFEAKNVAYRRRYRVWRRVMGTRGLKRGEVVINEALGGISDIRQAIANGALQSLDTSGEW